MTGLPLSSVLDNHKYDTNSTSSATRVVQMLLEREEAVSAISPEDQDLFRSFFAIDDEPLYSKSWAYITQAVNGRRFGLPLGMKYYCRDILIPIGYFPRPDSDNKIWHFHLVRPMGAWTAGSDFRRLCRTLGLLSRAPVYVKKLKVKEAELLRTWSGFHFVDRYPWHALAPEEDDTFQEVVLDTGQTLGLLEVPGRTQIKDHYRRFLRRYGDAAEWKMYSMDLQAVARTVVKSFFDNRRRQNVSLSVPDDYENMISSTPLGLNGQEHFANILQVRGECIGFCFAERLSGNTYAGVYANIALHEAFPYSSEFLTRDFIRTLQSSGITRVNLGGSETGGLHHFKLKFRPIKQEKMHWVVYDSNH
jgi:hypothetical protein